MPSQSYWQIVLGQLKRNRPAVLGFWCIVGIVLVAIYAPVLASDRPFYFRIGEDTTYPWFTDMFDRLQVTQQVDVFFNLLMIYLPLAVGVFLPLRSVLRRRQAWGVRPLRRTVLGLSAVFLWILAGLYLSPAAADNPVWKTLFAPGVGLRSSKPTIDYHDLRREAEARGEAVRAVFPPLPYHYDKTRVRETVLPPSWKTRTDLGAVGPHPLGTDTGGKDVLTTLLYGTRISITIGVLAVAIYVFIGIVLGAFAGYFGGKVDMVVSRIVEIFICLPMLFFILAIIAVFQQRSIFLIMFAIGLLAWPNVARLVRGEFLVQRSLDYVPAARALGIPARRVIFRHVLPNALTPVLVTATFGVAAAILLESSIAFLGLGDPTAASWGMILDKGRQTQLRWLILPPGIAIFLTVTAFNLLGEGLRDALDPKLRQ